MMKANFNMLSRGAVAVATLFALVVPSALLAQKETSAPRERVGFCGRVTEVAALLEQRLAEREAKVFERRSERAERRDSRREEHETRKEERHERWDVRRAELYAKLEAHAESDEEKGAALAAFKAAVDAAIFARRGAINAAQEQFRLNAESAFAVRQDALYSAINKFKSYVRAALDQAKTDCAAGVAPETVRENLHAGLKAARDQFAADREGLKAFKADLEEAIAARKAAVQAAIEEFKAALEDAKEALASAFEQDEDEDDGEDEGASGDDKDEDDDAEDNGEIESQETNL